MGLLAMYIDALPDPAKDRIIEEQDWTVVVFVDAGGSRCLLGVAENWCRGSFGPAYRDLEEDDDVCDVEWTVMDRYYGYGWSIEGALYVSGAFDVLCGRFGLDRIVRACKLRAARGNTPALDRMAQTVAGETVGAGRS